MTQSRGGRLREGEWSASVTQLEAAEPGFEPRSTLTHCSTRPRDHEATQTPLMTSLILQMVSLPAYLHVGSPSLPMASSGVGAGGVISTGQVRRQSLKEGRGLILSRRVRAKSQSCLTLCDPMDCNLPVSSVHGDSPGKNPLKWSAVFSRAVGEGFSHSPVSKSSACNAGDPGSVPGSGRSLGEGNGNPLQYSCLESPKDRGA